MFSHKPDLSDGMQVVERRKIYNAATGRWWKRYPELRATALTTILTEPLDTGIKPKIIACRAIGRKLWSFFRNARQADFQLPKCDVLLFHSSYKPNIQPAADNLINRLTMKGYRCAKLFGVGNMRISTKDIIREAGIAYENVRPYSHWMVQGAGYPRSLACLIRASIITLLLWFLLLRRGKRAVALLAADPFAVWFQIFMSTHRFFICKKILGKLQPTLAIVNAEWVQVGAELSLADTPLGTHRILLFNELPLPGLMPLNSKEIWVWNERAAEMLKSYHKKEAKKPVFSIVGSTEVDYACHLSEPDPGSDPDLRDKTNGRPVFLFLVDYDGSKMRNAAGIARVANRWLGVAAAKCPDWYFILKTRHACHHINLPGSEYLSDVSNVIISRGDIEYRDFLSWKHLRVVGAYSSTGLYVAAGAGKIAYRLMISKRQRPIPVIDDVAFPIHSPDELVRHLNRLAETTPYDDSLLYPYKGKTLERIESLCVKRIGEIQRRYLIDTILN